MGFDKKQLIEFDRNDIPDILLSNRFLELFSKPMEQRASFKKKAKDDKSPGKIVMSMGEKGELFNEFEFTLPKGSKVTKDDNRLFIDTKRFTIISEILYAGAGEVLPRGFEKYYLGYKSFDDFSTNLIEIKITVKFKNKSLISIKGWDYYEWIELFLEEIKNKFDTDTFFQSINWKQIYTQIKVKEINDE